MTTEADIGHGTTFEFGDGNSPEVWTEVAEIFDVSPPNLSRDTVDATHNKSANRWREYIGGLRDGGEISFEMNLVPGSDSEARVLTNFNGDSAEDGRITFPNGAKWTASVLVTGYEPAAPMDDKMTATVTLKVSGQPLLTEPA